MVSQNVINLDQSELVARLDDFEARIAALESGSPSPTPTPAKLTGVPFGTEGFYGSDNTNSYTSVFDGNTSTWFDSTTPHNAICGINLLQKYPIKKVRFHPRVTEPQRVLGGKFEYSLDGENYTLFHTVTQSQAIATWTELSVNFEAQYIRYISPIDGFGNIAEIELYS